MNHMDKMIKIRGHRINLHEIEQVLEDIPSIDNVSVTTCPCRSGNIVVAFYTANTRCYPPRKALLQSMKKQLPSYMLPILVRLEEIPLQPQTGKVDHMALKRLYSELCEVTSYDNNLSHYQLFLHVIANELGVPESLLEPNLSFSDVGGDSFAAVAIVIRLNDLGFKVKISDLLRACSFGKLAESSQRMVKTDNLEIDKDFLQDNLDGYEIIDLKDDLHKEEVIEVIARSFVEKNPMDVIVGTTMENFTRLVLSIWNEVITDDLSFFVIKSESPDGENESDSKTTEKKGTVVAATILLDVKTKIDPCFDKEEVAEIINAVENPVKEKLSSSEKWMECFMSAVDPSLPDGLSLSLLNMMEMKLLDLSQQRGYHGILTVNNNPVTMTVEERIFGYTVENTLHVKSFVWNERFPFKNAPDDYFIKAMTKRLKPVEKSE